MKLPEKILRAIHELIYVINNILLIFFKAKITSVWMLHFHKQQHLQAHS